MNVKANLQLMIACLTLGACEAQESEPSAQVTSASENILDLEIEGLSFVGADEVKAGWTTVRINNDGGMPHFGLVYRLPEGVTAEMVDEEVVRPLQASLTARIAGDNAEADRLLGTLPPWLSELTWMGGPGMMSSGERVAATMYLEPGNYIVECYVKTNGVQHNFNPDPGQFGMMKPFTVLPEPGGMTEPEANVTLAISNNGYEITEGQFVPGENRVRAMFLEQRSYNDFVGHDAHVFRIDPDTNVEAAAAWVDFFPVKGQETPAPAHFVGGIHDMPEGSTGYFMLDLQPGRYGITAEIPDAKDTGHLMTFEVGAE